jgi:Tfp pilus assembly protein PilE
MKTKTKSCKGLTIIELAVAIVTSIIVVLAIGIIIVFGQTSWNQTWKKVNLQRDASYAMLRMSQFIQAARRVESTDDKVLSINDGSTVFSYVEDTNDLQRQTGEQSEDVVNGKVYNLQFNVQGNTVRIDLTLRDGNVETRFVSTAMKRNS